MPSAARSKPIFTPQEKPAEGKPAPAVGTESIISKNLFDPERGAGATRETETNSRAFQRVRGMILLGTMILGNNRTAILQDPGAATGGPPAAARSGIPTRMKVGDSVEGFTLTEIDDRKVVFTRGASRVEVLLDYFRKVEPPGPRGQVPAVQPRAPGQVGPPSAAAPRVIPNLPRRERIPAQPSQ